MSASDFDLYLEDLQRRATGRLITAGVFDKMAFDLLLAYLRDKVELIKAEHVVSRQVLACLIHSAQAIENLATSVPGADANIATATHFSTLLELVAIGEGCKTRRAGVPRVV